ncbi:MAG: hypothetical protein KF716_10390 [Anaerolineae bacterium]|nr:hypothetical protein [Anaerolineae bacterium]
MLDLDVQAPKQNWSSLTKYLFVPRSEEEDDRLVDILNSLILIVREDEDHPLASLMDVIGTLIEKYEDDHVPELRE